MSMLPPEEFMEPATDAPDFKLNTMGKAQEEGWRRDTIPVAEDGTVPSVSQTVNVEGR